MPAQVGVRRRSAGSIRAPTGSRPIGIDRAAAMSEPAMRTPCVDWLLQLGHIGQLAAQRTRPAVSCHVARPAQAVAKVAIQVATDVASSPWRVISFVCGWLAGEPKIGDEWFPARCKMIIARTAEQGFLIIVDPTHPSAWRREPSDIAVAIRVNISSLRSIWSMLPRPKTFTGKTCINFVDSDQSGHEWRSPKYVGVR